MSDIEILKATLERLGLTYKAAAAILGISPASINQYISGNNKIPEKVWRGLLEHEAKIFQRQQSLQDQAARITGKANIS